MRGLTRRWVFRNGGPECPEGPGILLVDRLLHARGLVEPDTVRRFCDPKLTDLHPPDALPGVEAAARRLVEAVRGGRVIAIYGDYDVDGIAGTAILYHVLKAIAPGADVRTYVPHRLDEGYGLNAEALGQLRRGGADLVVSVDCGVTAIEPARAAAACGLELIITDHHHFDAGELLEAAVVVHPRLAGSAYPFGDLCGAGVAFKLAWWIAVTWCGSQRVSKALQAVLLEQLPLAALGTIADVVPLVDENRTIVTWGLRLIRQSPNAGLRALIEASDLSGAEIDCEKVGFVLAPRLNACGRMGHAAEAVHLLTAAEPAEAREIAGRLARLNRQRQETERRITEHAAQLAEDSGMTGDDRRAIVLADPSWHPGVVGIACSRLVDRYARPVVLLQVSEGACRGSARGVDGHSVHDALVASRRHLDAFGGHDAAAGLSLAASELDAFRDAFTAHANAHIGRDQLLPVVRIDCDADLAELGLDAVKRIRSLSPFGRANPAPTLRVSGALAGAPKQIGANGRHLTLSLRPTRRADGWLRAVWFDGGGHAADLAAGMNVEAVIEPKLNEWNGRTSVEGVVRDVRVVPQ